MSRTMDPDSAFGASSTTIPITEAIPRLFDLSVWRHDEIFCNLDSPWYPSYSAGLKALNQRKFDVALVRLSKVCCRMFDGVF